MSILKEWFSRKSSRVIFVFLVILWVSMILLNIHRMNAEPIGPETLVVQQIEKLNENQDPSDLILTFEDGSRLLIERDWFNNREMEAFAERLQPGTMLQATWIEDGDGIFDCIIGLELDGEILVDAKTKLEGIRGGARNGLIMMPLFAALMLGVFILTPKINSIKAPVVNWLEGWLSGWR